MVLVTQTSDTRILLPFFAPNQPFYHRVNGCYLFARTIFFEVFLSAFLSNLIASPETTRWVYPLPTVLVIKPMMQVLARVFLFCFLYLVKSLRRTFSQVTQRFGIPYSVKGSLSVNSFNHHEGELLFNLYSVIE